MMLLALMAVTVSLFSSRYGCCQCNEGIGNEIGRGSRWIALPQEVLHELQMINSA